MSMIQPGDFHRIERAYEAHVDREWRLNEAKNEENSDLESEFPSDAA